jgi:hypothetical protein
LIELLKIVSGFSALYIHKKIGTSLQLIFYYCTITKETRDHTQISLLYYFLKGDQLTFVVISTKCCKWKDALSQSGRNLTSVWWHFALNAHMRYSMNAPHSVAKVPLGLYKEQKNQDFFIVSFRNKLMKLTTLILVCGSLSMSIASPTAPAARNGNKSPSCNNPPWGTRNGPPSGVDPNGCAWGPPEKNLKDGNNHDHENQHVQDGKDMVHDKDISPMYMSIDAQPSANYPAVPKPTSTGPPMANYPAVQKTTPNSPTVIVYTPPAFVNKSVSPPQPPTAVYDVPVASQPATPANLVLSVASNTSPTKNFASLAIMISLYLYLL